MHITSSLVELDRWYYALTEYVMHPFITIVLCLLSVFVVLGNLLVVSAIWHENQLHSVTNYLIASLAAADCIVGAVVMPHSIISENILGYWPFGATWCDLWHSCDVLASTASIMNLCAISLDRYLAITDPISYPSRMTPKRVALLIVFLWTCSAMISFPAIIWWRAVGPSLQQLSPSTTTISPLDLSPAFISLTASTDSEKPLYRCVFTDDTYYLLFSSFISFYGPLCIMLYAYYRIYKAAVQQTRFLKHGSKQVMVGRNKKRSRHVSEYVNAANEKSGLADASCDKLQNMESYDRQHLVLRAHRGGGGGSNKSANAETSICASRTPNDHRRRENLTFDSINSRSSLETHRASTIRKKDDWSRTETPTIETIEDKEAGEDLRKEHEEALRAKNNKIMQCNQLKGQPLWASVNDRSSSVDVSIINHSVASSSNVGTTECDSQTLNISGSRDLSAPKYAPNFQKDSSFISTGHRNRPSNGVNCDYNIEIDEELSGDTVESKTSSSSSSSSESYGTGSIVSVMVRTEQNQNDPADGPRKEDKEDEEDEDHVCTNDCKRNNFKLRRALSLSEARQKEWAIKQHHTVTSNARTFSTMPDFTVAAHKQRSSCGSPCSHTKNYEVFTGPKSGKTLNFRSWVKLARVYRRQAQEGELDGKEIKTPSSLLPLILMNSDTSTDSSMANRQFDGKRVDSGNKNVRKFALAKKMEPNSYRAEDFASVGSIKRSALSRKRDENLSKDENIDKNLSFREDLEKGSEGHSGKAQVLYYDSDKLIQSIVDLTDIHYIDCASQGAKNPAKLVQEHKAEVVNEEGKTNLDQSENTQLPVSVRANIPRQHRSMGKKLSKLAKERKAAKTLGIVVGVFILCWLPFFVVNIVVALCGTGCIYNFQVCISIVTWLGWLNSAMNPVIYACWSRDFRRAFRRVLCTWVEFICPYDEACLAKKLRLKKSSNYSAQEAYLNRNVSSIKGNNSSATTRSGMSIEGTARGCSMNGTLS